MANKDFSLDMDSERDPRKRPKEKIRFNAANLDFFDEEIEATPKKNTRAKTENFRDDMWMMPHETRPESKTSRFMSLSIMAHALLGVGLMMISAQMFETPKPETVEIEIADSTPTPIPRGMKMEPTQGAQPAQAQKIAPEATSKEEPASANDVVVPAKKSQAKTAAKPVAAKTHAVKAAPVIAKQNSISPVTPVAKESEVAVPETVEDMEAPQLDENEFKADAVGNLNDGDLDKNFAKVDKKNAKGLKAVADEIDQDADQMEKSDLGAVDEMDRQTQKEAQEMAARSNELKKKNAAALAAAQAAENAAREKAARDAAARAEAARRAQAAADARGNGSSKTANGTQGEGSGSKGSTVGTTGVPNGGAIRSIEQLRQMPGNPKPAYNDSERMAKQQGFASFFAYITREGYPTQFKQARSTGYSNLDGKTLEALKKWRFYPGQEGWVEIPISWDLKGGASETRALGTRQNGAARSSLR